MNIDWNAGDYARHFSFVPRYGEAVLDLLDVGPGASVVDLGCGNGMLTRRLTDRGLRVTGIDASREMLDVARRAYPDLTFTQADALDFTLDTPVEAVFSNAVFHWIDRDRQPDLLRQVNRALTTGGRLVCEFGGKGCAASVHEALRRSFRNRGMDYAFGFYFPTIGEYAPLLEQAGFRVEVALLFDRPTPQQGGQRGLREWVGMFDKRPFDGLDDDTKNDILAEAEEALRPSLFSGGTWYIDYVRLRLKAIKQHEA